jgi:RNA polymerase primary sigma factor
MQEAVMIKTAKKQPQKLQSEKSVSSDENVLSLYLKEINKIPLLTREEEDRYARLAAQGDKDAREKLLKANLRFVVNVAKKYQNQGLPLSDLISEGNIGLINAIERYDVNKGYHFISYAVWWIRQAILKAICEKSRMIRLPLNRANELVQIEKARKLVQTGKTEDSEIREIARMLNMEEDHVAELVNISRDLVSLEAPVYSEKDSSSLGDFVEDAGYKHPEEVVIHDSLKEDINKILATLSEKEAEIIQYRFGLNGRNPLSLKEIGERYHLTKERIRQIEKKALKRMQHPSRSEILEPYLA